MEADWDLHAIVRGCAAAATTTTTTSAIAAATTAAISSSTTITSASSSVSCSSGSATFGYPMYPLFEPKGLKWNSSIAELHELCKPNFFFPKFHLLPNSFQLSSSPSSSSSSAPISSQIIPTHQKQHHHLPNNNKHSSHAAHSLTTPRSKRRKNQLKRVCQVPAEAVSSDIWAWRKYGQKPIKGSPYPRGYYRCSTSKVCLARKQVERNRSDPTMFIVTYTAEHNHPAPTHRNSLAGSTRQKQVTPAAAEDEAPTNAIISPATSGGEEELASEVTTRSESKEEEEEEENGFGLSDMELTDDFFEGLDKLTGSPPPLAVAGECIITSDPFPASVEFPASAAGGN